MLWKKARVTVAAVLLAFAIMLLSGCGQGPARDMNDFNSGTLPLPPGTIIPPGNPPSSPPGSVESFCEAQKRIWLDDQGQPRYPGTFDLVEMTEYKGVKVCHVRGFDKTVTSEGCTGGVDQYYSDPYAEPESEGWQVWSTTCPTVRYTVEKSMAGNKCLSYSCEPAGETACVIAKGIHDC